MVNKEGVDIFLLILGGSQCYFGGSQCFRFQVVKCSINVLELC